MFNKDKSPSSVIDCMLYVVGKDWSSTIRSWYYIYIYYYMLHVYYIVIIMRCHYMYHMLYILLTILVFVSPNYLHQYLIVLSLNMFTHFFMTSECNWMKEYMFLRSSCDKILCQFSLQHQVTGRREKKLYDYSIWRRANWAITGYIDLWEKMTWHLNCTHLTNLKNFLP